MSRSICIHPLFDSRSKPSLHMELTEGRWDIIDISIPITDLIEAVEDIAASEWDMIPEEVKEQYRGLRNTICAAIQWEEEILE